MPSRRSFLLRSVAALGIAPAILGTRVPVVEAAPVPDHLQARIRDVLDHPERYPDAMALARRSSGGTLTVGGRGLILAGGAAHGDRLPDVGWKDR